MWYPAGRCRGRSWCPRDPHIDIDPGGGRIDNGHAGAHECLAETLVEFGAQLGELDTVVRTGALPVVGEFQGTGGAARGSRCSQHVGQVHLTLVVVSPQGGQSIAQELRIERVDTCVDLVDRGLLGRRVALLNDSGNRTGGVADNAPVAGGILDARSQDSDGVPRALMGGDQLGQGVRRQERNIAVGDDNCARRGGDCGVESLEAALDGAAGAGNLILGRRCGRRDLSRGDFCGDNLALVAHDGDQMLGVEAVSSAQSVSDHGQASEGMHNLREG